MGVRRTGPAYRLTCMSPPASLARLGDLAIPALAAVCIVIAQVITERTGQLEIVPMWIGDYGHTTAQTTRCRKRKSRASGRNLSGLEQRIGGTCRAGQHTPKMVSLQVINAREAPLTDRAAKVLLGGLHVGPSGRKGRSGVNASVKSKRKSGGEKKVDQRETAVRSGGWYCRRICTGSALWKQCRTVALMRACGWHWRTRRG